jgi:hypothetical protein
MQAHDESADAVYGVLYESALTQMQLNEQAIIQQANVGFDSYQACAAWAKEHLLDILVYSESAKQFWYTTHKGLILTKHAYMDMYCEDVLFVRIQDEKGKVKRTIWTPAGVAYHNKARVIGEKMIRGLQPLSHRDYFTPTGYYDPALGTFNVARPFPVFAKETGADTSLIYEYIKAVGQECYMWLLAWLRAKMVNPKVKTEIVPVIISRAQGTGKSTFGEVICRGLFGRENVLVTDQHDSQARFNSDSADALIISQEEKEETDKRNTAATIKSRATATEIRKENKGIDPVYQASYTETIITSNNEVPIKFDTDTDQRRFMVMNADENFTRSKDPLADEVFTKLYGVDAMRRITGTPFVDDIPLLQQFKHELFTRDDIKSVDLRAFPKTSAYKRCFTMPRTNENVEIDSILRSLAVFVKASLENGRSTYIVDDRGEQLKIQHITQSPAAMQYVAPTVVSPAMVLVCRPLFFYDHYTNKAYHHSTVERVLYEATEWLKKDYGLELIPDMSPIADGMLGVPGMQRNAPIARFVLATEEASVNRSYEGIVTRELQARQIREGECLRVNSKWQPDEEGEFETVNELEKGYNSLFEKTKHVKHLDTFLLENDTVTSAIYQIEKDRARKWEEKHNNLPISSMFLYSERLRTQRAEAEKLFKQGIVRRIVYSGGKSYHILVRVADSPKTLEEYKWLFGYLCTTISDKLTFDPANSDPARLTRAPIKFPRTTFAYNVEVQGIQELIHENKDALYDVNWRLPYQYWLNRPMTEYEKIAGKRLVPCKQEYRDAMVALLNGDFWTSAEFNGIRQVCFFPAYRLCRMLGFDHDTLWGDSGILEGIDKYYRQSEIQYWKTRESSDIIKQIDQEVEELK